MLREVCILRRVAHPAVVGLGAAFVRPGTRGPFVMGADGRLHASTLDAYIAMEHCDGGDVFSLRGQLAAGEVRSLVHQIASALAHLHARGVAHRDVKSANVLVTRAPDGSGRLLAKLADFGSARSVGVVGGDGDEEDDARTLPHTDSFACGDDNDAAQTTTATRADISARPAATGGGGFRPPLTRVVATPCYRAPEVVMSRGGYTAVMDVWSLGCVFGELLQRVRRVGDAATPALRVAPLFSIKGLPVTPVSGGGGVTPATELDALFDVIGTPSWADIAAVASRPWRRHLAALPHRAPRLARTLGGGGAGEVALSLLARMLAFDPARRPSAAEVLAHEYFAEGEDGEEAEAAADTAAAALAPPPPPPHPSPPDSPSGKRPRHYYDEPDPARALALLEEEADRACDAAAAAASPSHTGPSSPHPAQTDAARRTEPGVAVLRALLEAECASLAAACRERGPAQPADAPPRRRGQSHGRPPRPSTHPQEDMRGRGDDDGGRDRLARVADAARGAALDPKDFLAPGRHGEWSGGREGAPGPPPGPAWGVSVLPPGVEDEGVADAVRRQQRR